MPEKSKDPFQFWEELKRRRVIRVITIYAAAAFVLLELVDIISEPFGLPDWTLKLVTVLLVIGFIISVILSWIYDVTPEGIEKTKSSKEVASVEAPPASKGWKVATYVSVLIIIAFVVFYIVGNNKKSFDISKLEKSIAVLPLEYLSEDPSKQYLANGVLDAITGHLSQIEGLRVMPRTSVEQYRENKKSAQEIGEELDVSFLIEGSFFMVGNLVKLTIQLVVAEEGDHIFYKEYDRDYSDIFAVQSEVAMNIAKEVEVAITPEQKQRIEAKPTENIKAYEYYLRAEEFKQKSLSGFGINKADIKSAVLFYNKAINLDPEFALAYVQLGNARFYQTFLDNYLKESFGDSLLWYAKKALTLNPDLPDAHSLKGMYYFAKNNMDSAIIQLKRAISLDPNMGLSYFYLGQTYIVQNNYVDAIDNFNKAKKLLVGDPNYGANLDFLANSYHYIIDTNNCKEIALELAEYNPSQGYSALGWLAFTLDDKEKLMYYTNQLCSLDSGWNCLTGLLNMHTISGDFDKALHYYELLNDFKRNNFSGLRLNEVLHIKAYILWNLGRKDEAMQFFDKQIEYCEESIELTMSMVVLGEEPYYELAGIYAFLGDKDKAFQNLYKLEKNNFPGDRLLLIKIDPLFESLREDEEFKAIIKRQEKKYADIRAELDKLREKGLL